jgi:hypothetical protein
MNGASKIDNDRTALIETKSVEPDFSGFFHGSLF